MKNRNTIRRSVLKTVTYRIIGTLTTSVITWGVTGNLKFGLAIGGIDVASKMVIYYIHERVWQGIDYGKSE